MAVFSIAAHTAAMKTNVIIPKYDRAEVAARVEALRKSRGLGKGDFALSVGLDPSSYSKILNLSKPLESEYAYAIAKQWGVTMDYLYFGDLSRIDSILRSNIITHLKKAEE